MSEYSISTYWDVEENEFLATSPEFPYMSAYGDTREKAIEELEEALVDGVELLEEENKKVPSPEHVHHYSGNIRIRIPRSLHRALAEVAKMENTSLNQFIVYLLSQQNERFLKTSKVDMTCRFISDDQNEWSTNLPSTSEAIKSRIPSEYMLNSGEFLEFSKNG